MCVGPHPPSLGFSCPTAEMPPAAPQLVGRASTSRFLVEALHQRRGGVHLALVGLPGVGKTAIVRSVVPTRAPSGVTPLWWDLSSSSALRTSVYNMVCLVGVAGCAVVCVFRV